MINDDTLKYVDEILAKLLNTTPEVLNKETVLSEAEVTFLCSTAKDIFNSQPIYLELSPPLLIGGDIHGQFFDLIKLFNLGGSPDVESYLFLGDYVDRGKYSIETISLLLAYKIKYPECFFMLRGNHECASISRQYGFFDECKRRYSIKIWKNFVEMFNCFPICASVDDKILCMHGGLSPELQSLDQLNKVIRPTDIPEQGLLCDLLWSDPDDTTASWEANERGISLTFSKKNIKDFLKKNDMDLVIRGHQVMENGWKFFGDKNLVTVFSARNYCNQFDNNAALMHVDENLMCSFKILKAVATDENNN